MSGENLHDLPMTRVVANTVGQAAALIVSDATQSPVPAYLRQHIGEALLRDLLTMPEGGRAHLAAMLMRDNREPLRLQGSAAP